MDPDAQQVTLNYEGGSLTTSVGVAKSLFGDNYDLLVSIALPVNTSVSSHSRTRIIGAPSSTVSAHTRQYQQWPTSNANNAAAGKKVLLTWEGSSGDWVGRVTGAMADFGTFLSGSAPKAVKFRTSRGTKYGPYVATVL
jgi:hypothetical protein